MWPFDKKQPPLTTLPFKDALSAVEYACQFMTCKWTSDVVLPAVATGVIDGKDGLQNLSLLVAHDDGPKEVPFCTTINNSVPRINTGDLVAFLIAEHIPSVEFMGTIGFVVLKLKPTFDLRQSCWLPADDQPHP